MNQYVNPIISIASGITEGIYTASGVTPNAVTLGALKVLNDWGTNGQLIFAADFSALSNRCPLTLTVTFNATISSAWGGGCSSDIKNGNTAYFKWENGNTAPETAELTVQVSSTPSTVQITGYSYTQS